MDDSTYGKRDKRGDWKPNKLIKYPPVFTWPAQPIQALKWFFGYPGYLWPNNFLFAIVALLVWLYATPALETTKTFSVDWIAFVFFRNAAIVAVFFGYFHYRLYIQKKQGTSFKFNGQWPSSSNSSFLFKSQNVDNLIWTFASGVPIWTAFEVLTLWLFANGHIAYLDFAEHPVYGVLMLLAVPFWRDFHFYAVHRLIHIPWLYKIAHKTHHNNVNPGPWSGLSMHPIEHLLYFTCVCLNWVIVSHPVHAIYNLMHAGLSPAPGHAGFDKVVLGENTAYETHSYDHYLHHKYFECNYADGVVPFDKWFGTFHDGSKEAQEKMDDRFMATARKKAERQARKQAQQAGE